MNFVIGLDFGTDSVRAVLVDASDGHELNRSVFYYPRWKKGLYCNTTINQFRQHPLDYIEGLEATIKECTAKLSDVERHYIKGIAVDTTGSTPVAVDRTGTPLSLLPGFEENPHAMFILWKDHTAIQEAEEINRLSQTWDTDYTQFEGGVYSSEWFWAKILRTLRKDEQVRASAYSWVEHCDWIPYLLTGERDVFQMKRSRCAAGHKAMWHEDFGGLPPNAFFTALDPLLDGLTDRLYTETYTSDVAAGTLSAEWAERLELPSEVTVAVGAFDAHMGAVGGQIEPYYLSKVMGTSTCDMLVAPLDEVGDQLVHGICGQVNGSIIPGMLGLEAGQSAFGDVYAWFKDLIAWPIVHVLGNEETIDLETREALVATCLDRIIPKLTQAAMDISPESSAIVALDWLNGRRTPIANQALKGAIMGLNLGSDAPKLFRALVEATCFGARKIVERFQDEGIPVLGIIGLGGVARKSPFIMQTMANVLDRPIKISASDQTCALGASMFAARAAGIFSTMDEAMSTIGPGFDTTYQPDSQLVEVYNQLYKKYSQFGQWIESSKL